MFVSTDADYNKLSTVNVIIIDRIEIQLSTNIAFSNFQQIRDIDIS